MFKVSIPMSVGTMNEENIFTYVEYAKACGADRVFLCGMGEIFMENSRIYTEPERVKMAIQTFRESGVEVGVWVNTLGHGVALIGEKEQEQISQYTSLEGVGGDKPPFALCPGGEAFLTDFAKGISTIAGFGPDIIMLDDDFRFGRYQYYFGCFCPKHLARFYELVGEEVPRGEIEKRIYTGGKNPYRDAYRTMISETMLEFAKRMREAIDAVDPTIRFGLAGALENWDADGLHLPDLIRTFSGSTKPFFRTHGAPYWSIDIMKIIENTRMQCKWLHDEGIEGMGEGDTYPRPRYNVPFKTLELFQYALIADEYSDGMLAYIVDYTREPEYETGYIEKFIKCQPQRLAVEELFRGKHSVGVTMFHPMHKIETWQLPEQPIQGIAHKLHASVGSTSTFVLSKNSIPTSWNDDGYPLMLMGEDARTVDKERLKHGAILDVVSARILTERGIDVGMISAERAAATGEHYMDDNATIPSVDGGALYKMTCSPDVQVLSYFKPHGAPASYRYENADGMRFYVIAFDLFRHDAGKNIVSGNPIYNFLNNYYRQEDMIEAIEWMCGKRLPAKALKNPNLYIYTAKDASSMSVLLLNIHLDSIDEPVIELDHAYTNIKCVNCTGVIEGDRVRLSLIPGYGMAAFEVC